MIQSQPLANLRLLQALLYDTAGAALSAAVVWVAGMARLSKAGGAFVNTTNLPSTVTGGGANSFKLQLTAAECDTLGTLRIQFFDAAAGSLIAEYVDEVVVDTLDTVVENGKTLKSHINVIKSATAGKAAGFDGLVRTYRDDADTKDRITATTAFTGRTAVVTDGV